ncbi:MAG: nucleotide exchange factor GrpE [Candidatus Colwellbacteria bacterium]|nr:nucleotide exchange factor GrpE [Candidatus Colwellbacteria bacterium]
MSENVENKKDDTLEKIKAERDEYLNGWKRAKADLINYQKEEAARLEQVAKFGALDIVLEVLGILHGIELGIKTAKEAGKEPSEGLLMLKKRMEDLIAKRGIAKISVVLGEEFNPEIHEAVAVVEATEKLKSGTIAEVLEPGYTMHSRVVKASKVKVVK